MIADGDDHDDNDDDDDGDDDDDHGDDDDGEAEEYEGVITTGFGCRPARFV